mgnify:CR=1 FL=1
MTECRRRHSTRKRLGDPTYSAKWSGVTGAPRCFAANALTTACGHECYHHEGDSHYCPGCDDYKPRPKGCTGEQT